MNDEEVKKLFELANEKFEGNFKYTIRKTKQDFIDQIKSYFSFNITTENRIKYNNQLVPIKDLEKEFEVNLEINNDVNYLNDFSGLKSAITLFISIFISIFIGSQKINYSDDKFTIIVLIGLIIGVTSYVILTCISHIERKSRRNGIYLKIFYSLCLKIIKELNT